MASSCEAELCPYWTGQGCACTVLGIERTEAEVCVLCSYSCNASCGCECGC